MRYLSVIESEDHQLLSTTITKMDLEAIEFDTEKPIPERGLIRLSCPGLHFKVSYQLERRTRLGQGFRGHGRLVGSSEYREQVLNFLRFVS